MCGMALPFRWLLFFSSAAAPPDVRNGSAFPKRLTLFFRATPVHYAPMFTISKNTQALYITAVAKDRLPVFQRDEIKTIVCKAIDEARTSCGFLLLAYVIMPDHLHLLTDGPKPPSEVLRYIKGIVSRRVIDYLKEKGYETSLQKLRHEEQARGYRYSLWQHDTNVFQIFSEAVFMQKVNYIHLNPVRAEMVGGMLDYRWSSARCWRNRELDDEPLQTDHKLIQWRNERA
jgi:putative transposase